MALCTIGTFTPTAAGSKKANAQLKLIALAAASPNGQFNTVALATALGANMAIYAAQKGWVIPLSLKNGV